MKTINNAQSDEPPSGYSALETIILQNYIDHAEIIATLRKNSYEATLHPSLKKIDHYIKSEKFESIPNIVGTLLTTINDKLSHLKDKEKYILEVLSGELFSGQIDILNSTEEGKKCWEKCLIVLKDTCEFKGYDFKALSQILKIDFIKTITISANVTPHKLPYYEWLGNQRHLEDLIRDLKDKQWIRNVNQFKKIFKPISDPNYNFCAPSEHKEKLLVFFSVLKTEKLILPRRTQGHLYPLKCYAMDLEKKLFEKEPKRYLENLSRKKEYKALIVEEVRKLIRLNQ